MARQALSARELAAFQSGDNKLFAELIVANSSQLRAYSHKFARDQDEEAELLQDTWVLAWERRATYRGTGTMAGWLRRLARTICLRSVAQRREFANETVLSSVEAATPPSVAEAIARQDLEDDRLSIILALAPRRRHVVLMRLLLGWSTKETARVLKCSAGTVKASYIKR